MKRAILIFLLLAWAAGAGAQGISRVSAELERTDPATGARIEVRARDDAAAALRLADHNPTRSSVVAYGVSLFRDNSQDARARAYGAAEQFAEMYPDIPVVVSYESPYFLVTAGGFVDRTDAVALVGRVQSQFRNALVVQREISLAELIVQEKEKKGPTLDNQE